jgi:hypothetical protein
MDSWPIVIQRVEFWPIVTLSFIMKHVYFGPMCICRIVICSIAFLANCHSAIFEEQRSGKFSSKLSGY